MLHHYHMSEAEGVRHHTKPHKLPREAVAGKLQRQMHAPKKSDQETKQLKKKKKPKARDAPGTEDIRKYAIQKDVRRKKKRTRKMNNSKKPPPPLAAAAVATALMLTPVPKPCFLNVTVTPRQGGTEQKTTAPLKNRPHKGLLEIKEKPRTQIARSPSQLFAHRHTRQRQEVEPQPVRSSGRSSAPTTRTTAHLSSR